MKIGLIGLGHLGKIHFKCLKQTKFELIGIYDPILTATDYEGFDIYKSSKALLDKVDACVIAAATTSHYELAKEALMADKHVFVEKPMTSTISEARELAQIASDHPDLITQVGFVERYNPVFRDLQAEINNPKFMEVHRLSTFNPRGNDVSVVQDLMIHDLDMILAVKKVPIRDIRANGVSVVSDSMDICNARIEF